MRQHYPLDSNGDEDAGQMPWRDGVPSTGVQGSYPGHALVTDVEAEILAAIDGGGYVRNGSDLTQLLQTIARGLWLGQFGGTATQLSATLPNNLVIPSLQGGLRVRGIAASNYPGGGGTLKIAGVGTAAGVMTCPIVAPDGVTALGSGAWKAGQFLTFDIDASGNARFGMGLSIGDVVSIVNQTAILPATAAVTLYTDTAGVDATADGSQGKPFRTNTRALSYAASRFSFGGFGLALQALTQGVYDLPAIIQGVPTVTILGSPGAPGAYTWQGAGTSQAQCTVAGCNVTLTGGTLSNTNPALNTVGAVSGGNLTLTNVLLGGTSALSLAHVLAGSGGSVALTGTVGVTQGAGAILDAEGGSITSFATIAVPAGGSFSTALVVANGAGANIAFGTGAAWQGTTGGKRFAASLNGVINTFGRGIYWIPGTIDGTKDGMGGQYA